MWMTWLMQWIFIVGFGVLGYFDYWLLAVLCLLLSFGCHVLSVTYRGVFLDYLQKLVDRDPLYGLDGQTKRRIRRKIERNGAAHKS
jgi:hypothetical protein